jgi:hypothetical protein
MSKPLMRMTVKMVSCPIYTTLSRSAPIEIGMMMD